MAFAFSESSTVTPDEMTIAHGQGDHEYSVKVIEFRGAINDDDVRKALENLPDGTKKLFSFRRPCCLILSGTHGAVEKDPLTNEPICSTVVDTVIQDRRQDAPRFAQEDKRIAFEKNLPSTFPYNVKVLDLGDPCAESVPEALNRWKPTLVVKAYCHSARQTFNKEIADYVKNEADALKNPSSSNREENIEPRSSQENQGFRSWLAQRMEAPVPNLSENQEAPVPNLSENQEAPVPNLSENQEAW